MWLGRSGQEQNATSVAPRVLSGEVSAVVWGDRVPGVDPGGSRVQRGCWEAGTPRLSPMKKMVNCSKE